MITLHTCKKILKHFSFFIHFSFFLKSGYKFNIITIILLYTQLPSKDIISNYFPCSPLIVQDGLQNQNNCNRITFKNKALGEEIRKYGTCDHGQTESNHCLHHAIVGTITISLHGDLKQDERKLLFYSIMYSTYVYHYRVRC